MSHGLTMGEWYCGAGVGAVGFLQAGYKIDYAFDFNPYAVKTYKLNHGDHAYIQDAKTLDLNSLPDVDVITGGFPCFPANQRIITSGGYRNIEDIKVGDYVLTHRGRLCEVLTTMQKQYNGDLYELVCKYYKLPIKVTSEHPFFTERGWVEAKYLTNNDYVGFPLNKNNVLPSQITYQKKVNQTTSREVTTKLKFNSENFWRLIGYWLADGWTTDKRNKGMKNAYRIMFATTDKKDAFILPILNQLGIKYSTSNERTCGKIHVVSQDLWLFIKQFTTGTTASDKILPEFIQDLPINFARSLIDGYIAGDGHVNAKNAMSFYSISVVLLEGIQRLFLKTDRRLLSLNQVSKSRIRFIEDREVNTKDGWRLRGGAEQGGCANFTDTHVFFKIDSIVNKYVSDVTVYNIEVAEDNSYCLPMISVHNCQPFSVGGTGLGEKDERKGNLGFYFFNGIKEKMPKAFLAENVEGLTHESHIGFFYRLLEFINLAGYNVSYKVVDCWEYGVPQTRSRVFIAGIRKDLNKEYYFPNLTPVSDRPTLRDAIGDLPTPEEAEKYGIRNHSRYHEGGFSSRDLKSKTRQRQWNEPSYTIVSSDRHMPMYPEPANYDWRKMTKEQMMVNPPPRRFTVRECLRLQSVPDSFYFPDDDSYSANSLLSKQYERCSGIPPIVSYKLSKQLADILTGNVEVNKPTQRKLF
jgi:DNA-cytosine methyltransferase